MTRNLHLAGPRRFASLLCTFGLVIGLLAPSARADVLIVDSSGAGDFLRVQHAINAATSGDVILVRQPGATDTGGWVLDGKALTIVGDVPIGSTDRVSVSGGTVRNLPAGQTVVLRNLRLLPEAVSSSGFLLDDNAGAVWVENCEAQGKTETSQVFLDQCQNQVISPGAAGLEAQNCAAVIVVRSVLAGGDGSDAVFVPGPVTDFPATHGKAGLLAVSSEVAIYESELLGGDGGGGLVICGQTGNAGHGLMLVAATALLVDSSATGGAPGSGLSGDGVRGLLGTQLEQLFSTAQAGAGGTAMNIPPASVTTFTGAPRLLRLPSPLREGEVGTLQIQGVQGDAVGILFSFNAGAAPLPTRKGWFVLDPGALVGPYFLGVISAPSGALALPLFVPLLPAGTEGFTVHMQGWSQTPGGITLSSGASSTLLDASF
ncbi:MAG: hypothetical protein ACT4PU_05860 [Planctomycetota bacterium]